ncbi:hypothetical protein [Agrobacterium tumefaciens]|uniref:hypothetical protein n=1 Tax=Agrobacterium tumefaciens TaxID=358 RepID=UPI0021CE7841|nr:hypothetical protein [Agrobacterium tumefaciens]UXS05553.1 hypothetical protein FY156_28910 [Agrobacterium tumefaciens]
MKTAVPDRYSIEELQEAFGVSLQQAIAIYDKFAGDKSQTDKMMRRYPHTADVKETGG